MSIEGHRRLIEVIPDPVREWWEKWELRGLILLSLWSQMILTILGNRSKCKPNRWRRALVWSSYLLADWIAAFAMGVISSNLGDYYYKGQHKNKNFNHQLIAFWAPFFLMHLGGPDSITAYALEDNELWPRHLVGLGTQTVFTVYIILMSWKGNRLSHLSILMLVIGLTKYGERTWSLYCGSIKHLRDSFLRSIDSPRHSSEQWPDTRASPAGAKSFLELCFGLYKSFLDSINRSVNKTEHRTGDPRTFLRSIYIFVSLFSDLVLSPLDINQDRIEFRSEGHRGWKLAFETVHSELKLMYDVFYTKAFANYGILGLMSRLITFAATITVLVLYANLSENNKHLVVDRVITYLLLTGALISEIHAIILVASSKWTRHYFVTRGLQALCVFQDLKDCLIFLCKGRTVWISFGQSNFFTLICDKNLKLQLQGNLFPMNKLKKLLSVSPVLTSPDLLQMIFRRLYNKSEGIMQSGYRDLIKGKNMSIFESELEFHRTIITWHIATDLFYYSDGNSGVDSRNSKQISDYMFYLLVKQRHMLPVGAGLITLRDTVIETVKFFEHMEIVPQQGDLAQACRILRQHHTRSYGGNGIVRVEGTSVLFHACEIAKELIARNRGEMWQFMEELWVEIMCYAGAYCRVDMHAHHLRRGSEFLSHIWLLEAHFGLLDQFQITHPQESV